MVSDLLMGFRMEHILFWHRFLPARIGRLAARDIKRMIFEGKRDGK